MRAGAVHVYMLHACSGWSRVFPVLYLLMNVGLCVHTYLNVHETLVPWGTCLEAKIDLMCVVYDDVCMYMCVLCVYVYVYVHTYACICM